MARWLEDVVDRALERDGGGQPVARAYRYRDNYLLVDAEVADGEDSFEPSECISVDAGELIDLEAMR